MSINSNYSLNCNAKFVFLQIKKAGKKQVGNWASQDFRWTGCSLWLSPDFCLQAQQQISEYHNCKKDLKGASRTACPAKRREREATAVRAFDDVLETGIS